MLCTRTDKPLLKCLGERGCIVMGLCVNFSYFLGYLLIVNNLCKIVMLSRFCFAVRLANPESITASDWVFVFTVFGRPISLASGLHSSKSASNVVADRDAWHRKLPIDQLGEIAEVLAGGAGPGLGLAQRDPVAVDLHRPGKLVMLSRLALSVSLTQKRFAISAHLQQLV